MNACDFYVEEACRYADMIQDVDMYSYLFLETEGDPETAETVKSNEQNAEKAKGMIRRAIDAIKKIYNKIKDTIKEIWAKLTMSKEERMAYDEFCQKIKNDPAMKNKKVTVKNFREIDAAYKKLVDEIHSEIESAKKLDEELRPKVKDRLLSGLNNLANFGKTATVTVTVDQLILKAKQNQEFAKTMDTIVNNDLISLDSVLKDIDKADATRLKKEIHKAANLNWLQGILARARYRRTDIEKQAQLEQRQALSQLKKSLGKLALNPENGDIAKEALKIGANAAKQAGGHVIKDMKQIHSNKKASKAIDKTEKRLSKKAKKTSEEFAHRQAVNAAKRANMVDTVTGVFKKKK